MTYAEWIADYVKRNNDFVRGKCKEACDELVKAFPELRIAAGFAHVSWGRDQHFWCVAPDGKIVDPTKAQFQFGVVLQYEELNLDDPATQDLVPIGKCVNCGEETYNSSLSEGVCSQACQDSYVRYLNTEARGFWK